MVGTGPADAIHEMALLVQLSDVCVDLPFKVRAGLLKAIAARSEGAGGRNASGGHCEYD